MARRLLAIGECMIELSPGKDADYSVGYAGDTFNTAWYARQMATSNLLEVSYFSAVGDDEQSCQMVAFMQNAGIDTHMARVSGASAGLYMILLDRGERSFQYWRSASAARHMAEHLDTLPDMHRGDIVYFSGITMAILPEGGRKKLLAKLEDLSRHGAEIIFDPNLRPRLWDNADQMKRWTMKAAALAGIVLPSFEDEAVFFGDQDTVETADRYLENGARIAVVKNGPEPVVVKASDGDEFQFQPEAATDIVDTTAAGDSFNAAFIVDYLERNRLRDAVRSGCALARHVVSHRGALVPVSKMGLIRERAVLRA
jgi:2-dehydro-3-deoxygluconokinase